MTQALSTFTTRYLDRATVLRSVLDSQGPALFARILQERAVASQPTSKQAVSYRELWKDLRAKSLGEHAASISGRAREAKAFFDEKILETLLTHVARFQSTSDKEQEVIRILAQALGTYGGAVVGLNLPSVDIRFFSSETPDQTVVFHSAPRLFTRVSLEWMAEVLRLASVAPGLEFSDRKFFATLQALTQGLSAGIGIGTSVRDEVWRSLPGLRSILHREQPLPIDAQSLKMASYWIQEMLRAASRKDPK